MAATPGYASQGWARFLAKWVDGLFAGALVIVLALLAQAIMPEIMEAWRDTLGGLPFGLLIARQVVVVCVFILFDAVCLSLFARTPGRVLLGLKVVQSKTSGPPSFDQAMGRTIRLWGMGLGLGLPFISIMTVSAAWFDLLKTGSTAWDDGSDLEVRHVAVHPLRWTLAIAVFVGLIALRIALLMARFASIAGDPIAPT